eukprot:3451590-Pleurochrysis_carterae.AAC.1
MRFAKTAVGIRLGVKRMHLPFWMVEDKRERRRLARVLGEVVDIVLRDVRGVIRAEPDGDGGFLVERVRVPRSEAGVLVARVDPERDGALGDKEHTVGVERPHGWSRAARVELNQLAAHTHP